MTRKMKDSGIEWIGEIPEEWEVVRIKMLCKTRNGLAYSNSDLCDEDEGTLVLRASNIKEGELTFKDNVYVNKNIPSDLMVKDGDILICSTNGSKELVGKNAIIRDIKASFGAFMMVLRCDNPEMMYYILNSSLFDYHKGSFSTTTINQLTKSNLNNMKIPWSRDSKSRELITLFLNKKSLLIEKIKNTILKEIENLESYKKSVITEAVTKGLDKNVEMKDSGIEWIGEIPKHWNVTYLKSFFDEGKNKNKLGRETNLLSLSYGEIIKKDINTQTGLLPQNFNNYNIVEEGSIIIRPTDLQNDKKSLRTGLVNEKGIITSAYINLKPKKNVASKYFHYLLHCYDLMKVFYNMGSGVRQGLTYSEFSKLLVLSPNSLEQEQIISYLDRKTKVIDETISLKQKQLETLEEYKKSLIYEYVTGKKEVKDGEET